MKDPNEYCTLYHLGKKTLIHDSNDAEECIENGVFIPISSYNS